MLLDRRMQQMYGTVPALMRYYQTTFVTLQSEPGLRIRIYLGLVLNILVRKIIAKVKKSISKDVQMIFYR